MCELQIPILHFKWCADTRAFILGKVLSTLKIYECFSPVDYFDVFTFLFPTTKSNNRRKLVLAVGNKITGSGDNNLS